MLYRLYEALRGAFSDDEKPSKGKGAIKFFFLPNISASQEAPFQRVFTRVAL